MLRLTVVGMLAALLFFVQCAGVCLVSPPDQAPAAEQVPPCHPQKPAGGATEPCGHGKIDVEQPRGFAGALAAGPAAPLAIAAAAPLAVCRTDCPAPQHPAVARRASPPLRI